MKNINFRWLYDKIRVVSLYVLVFFILFIIQKYTIGFIPGIKNIIIFGKFYFYEILFAVIAIIVIKFFIKIEAPRLTKRDKFFSIKKIRNNHN